MKFIIAIAAALLAAAAPTESDYPQSGRVQFLRADNTKVETSGPVGECYGIKGDGATRLKQVLELTPGVGVFYYGDVGCARDTRINETPGSNVGSTADIVANADVNSIRLVDLS